MKSNAVAGSSATTRVAQVAERSSVASWNIQETWIHVLTHMKSMHEQYLAAIAGKLTATERRDWRDDLLETFHRKVMPEIHAYFAVRVHRELGVELPFIYSHEINVLLNQVWWDGDLYLEDAEERRREVEATVGAVRLVRAKRTLIAAFAVPMSVNEFFIQQLRLNRG